MTQATTDVKEDSSTSKATDTLSSQGKGASEKTVDERGVSWENRAKEYERKYNEAAGEKEELESRLQELEDKVRLTESEKAEKAKLEAKSEDLEEELRILETDKKYRAYNEKIRRESEKTKKEAVAEAQHSISISNMEEFLEDKSGAEVGTKEYKKFYEGLQPYAKKYIDRLPHVRAKLAYKDWQKSQDLSKREAEIAKKEAELKAFTEGEGRIPRETTTLDEARKKGDVLSEMKHLGL